MDPQQPAMHGYTTGSMSAPAPPLPAPHHPSFSHLAVQPGSSTQFLLQLAILDGVVGRVLYRFGKEVGDREARPHKQDQGGSRLAGGPH